MCKCLLASMIMLGIRHILKHHVTLNVFTRNISCLCGGRGAKLFCTQLTLRTASRFFVRSPRQADGSNVQHDTRGQLEIFPRSDAVSDFDSEKADGCSLKKMFLERNQKCQAECNHVYTVYKYVYLSTIGSGIVFSF